MKRSPINRKTPLARGTKQLKRTRMNPISKTKKTAAEEKADRHFQDGVGMYLDQISPTVFALARKISPRRLVFSEATLDEFRGEGACQLCGYCGALEPHHLASAKGRSDERCNLIAVCRKCHDEIQGDVDQYKRVWRAKWEADRAGTNWLRLCLLLGRVPFDTLD
jgi:hypothetical protein